MRHLPKHLQPRWRYLAVEVESPPDGRIGEDALQRAIWYATQNLLGDPGSAAVDGRIVRFDGDRPARATVRVRRGHVPEARAAIACVDTVDGVTAGPVVRGVAGTIRACEEKYMNGDRVDST